MSNKPFPILLVEDNDDHADLVFMAIEDTPIDCIVDRAVDGEQALEYLRQEGDFKDKPMPGIVLLDLNLPKLNGFDVLRVMRGDDVLKNLPVVVITTSSAENDQVTSAILGVGGYMTKPFDPDKFEKMINRYLEYWVNCVFDDEDAA